LRISYLIQEIEGCLSAIVLFEQRPEWIFVLVHYGQFQRNGLDLSQLFSLIIGKIFLGFSSAYLLFFIAVLATSGVTPSGKSVG